MRIPILESDKLLFLETGQDDLDTILSMENNEEIKKFVYTWSKDRHLAAIQDPDEGHLLIKEKSTDETIGYILLSGLKQEDQSIELRRIALCKRGLGYGQDALALIQKLCFERYSCHRLWLDVFADNQRALHLYLKMGFIQEGILRECKKSDSGYRSMIILSMLAPEYEKLDLKLK